MRKYLLLILPTVALTLAACSGDDITTIDDDSTGGGGNTTVTLTDPSLSWSKSAYTATLGEDNTYPTLNNDYGVAVTYSSSQTGVATISSSGVITLKAAGTTIISAQSAATSTYSASNAYYTLTVQEPAAVELLSAELSWPVEEFEAQLETTPEFPVLNNPHGLTVSYSSLNTAVADISQSGVITLKTAGSTIITATSQQTDTYQAGSASYTLNVTKASSTTDDGAGTFTYPSSGDTSSEDDISTATFTRKITVTFSTSGNATVSGDYYEYATVSGNHVTINNSGTEFVVYELKGTTSNGSIKLYGAKKQAIHLNGVNITNPSGAAINNQSGKRTYVYVEGTNKLADGSSAAYTTTGTEDMKAVFFSEGQLIFSGSGSLTVTANNAQSKSGIVSDDYVRFMSSPTVTVSAGTSSGHGVRGKDYVQITDGSLDITAKAAMKKGIGSDDYVLIEGGTANITVSGGVAYDSEDKEYTGTAGIKADNYFAMTGGTVTIKNTGTGGKGVHAGSYDYDSTNHTVADSYISGGTLDITTSGSESNDVSSKGIKIGWVTKSGSGWNETISGSAGNLLISGGSIKVTSSKSEGIEAKGDIRISGGQVYVTSSGDDAMNATGELNVSGGYVYAYSSANDGMDANKDMKLSGGYVFAITTKGNPEVALDANTEKNYKLYIYSGATVVAYGGLEKGYSASQSVYSMSGTANAWNALHNGSSYLCAFKAPSGLSSFAVSAPGLSKGYKGVSVGSSTFCNGVWATSNISGGTSVSLSNYLK